MKSKSVKKIVLGFVIGAILVVSLIGCKDAEETVPEASTSEVISEVESEVISEEVAEDMSEEAVLEEVSEEENEMPEIVDGVQIVNYSNEEELEGYCEKIENPTIAVFNFTFVEKGQAILYDSAHYTIEKDFFMTINSSKKIQTVNAQAEYISITNSVNDDGVEWRLFVDTTGKDIEVPLTIIYEDGMDETLTVYITKEWKWSWEE